MTSAFQTALTARADAMVDACTTCGKCFEACPIKEPAGVAGADPRATTAGILDIVRTGDGPDMSRKWASACVLSGECIKACVDLKIEGDSQGTLAREGEVLVLIRSELDLVRHQALAGHLDRAVLLEGGLEGRAVRFGGQDKGALPVGGRRILERQLDQLRQLTDDILERLGQLPTSRTARDDLAADVIPDVVFYTGCNVLKTPHIALLALDIMDALGTTYHVMGGPSHCCGIVQLRPGDVDTSGRFGENTMDKLARSKSGQVLAWCPSCLVQFNEVNL